MRNPPLSEQLVDVLFMVRPIYERGVRSARMPRRRADAGTV